MGLSSNSSNEYRSALLDELLRVESVKPVAVAFRLAPASVCVVVMLCVTSGGAAFGHWEE